MSKKEIVKPRGCDIPAGSKFGRWAVVEHEVETIKGQKMHYYVVICDCGNTRRVLSCSLVSGASTSCGCYRREVVKACNTTHGDSRIGSAYNRLFDCWVSMMSRCYNEKATGYDTHGGRGITVCNEWRTYPPFKEWALANGYEKHLTLDRYPNNESGDYEPSNCRFATYKEQNRNRRDNLLITAFGETKCLAEWADDSRCVVGYMALWHRLKSGMEAELAITKPSQRSKTKGGS